MIKGLEGMPDGILGFEVTGRLEAQDYTTTLVPAVSQAATGAQGLRVVMIVPDEFTMEPAAAWQDLKLGVREWTAWKRIALVTDHEWLRDGLRAFGWLSPGDVAVFTIAERDRAIAWAAEG